MKTNIIHLLGIILVILFFASCQTKEERIIAKFENLSEYIDEGKDSFSTNDWEQIFSEYLALQKEARDCDFSQEQLKEVGRADAYLTAIITKEASKKLGRDVAKFINNGKDVLNGFIDGLSEE